MQSVDAQLPNCILSPPNNDYSEYYCDCKAYSVFKGQEDIEREYNQFGGFRQGWYRFTSFGFDPHRFDTWGSPSDGHDTLEEVLAQYGGYLEFEPNEFDCSWTRYPDDDGGGGGGGGGDDDDTEW